MRRETEFEFPRNLLFNHRVQLLGIATSDLSPTDQILAENVKRTIRLFPGHRVIFFDDNECQSALKKYQFATLTRNGTLDQLFVTETAGEARSDFCRLVMLREFGGLYFDNDLVVLQDPRPLLAHAHFATVVGRDTHTFFQAFTASVPQHPLLKLAMSLHSEYYADAGDIDRRAHMAGLPGPKMLRESFDIWTRANHSSSGVTVPCLLSGACVNTAVGGFRTVLLREVCPEPLCGCLDDCACYVASADQSSVVFMSRMKYRNGSRCVCGERLLPFHRGHFTNIDCSNV